MGQAGAHHRRIHLIVLDGASVCRSLPLVNVSEASISTDDDRSNPNPYFDFRSLDCELEEDDVHLVADNLDLEEGTVSLGAAGRIPVIRK